MRWMADPRATAALERPCFSMADVYKAEPLWQREEFGPIEYDDPYYTVTHFLAVDCWSYPFRPTWAAGCRLQKQLGTPTMRFSEMTMGWLGTLQKQAARSLRHLGTGRSWLDLEQGDTVLSRTLVLRRDLTDDEVTEAGLDDFVQCMGPSPALRKCDRPPFGLPCELPWGHNGSCRKTYLFPADNPAT